MLLLPPPFFSLRMKSQILSYAQIYHPFALAKGIAPGKGKGWFFFSSSSFFLSLANGLGGGVLRTPVHKERIKKVIVAPSSSSSEESAASW
ncbi:hypothetical protein Peur_016246 [Populus x canadensis]